MQFKARNGKLVKVTTMDALGETYKGICTECGAKRGECEPDATNYECTKCHQLTVFGILELLVMGRIN